MRPVFILASTSPRRRELIQLFGLPFRFISADVDETPRNGEPPDELVYRLASAKVARGASEFPDAIVIAADTIGVLDGTILGKPRDSDDAIRMLKMLRERPHIVYSGIAVARETQRLIRVATTTVWMRDYSDAEIATYVATGDPLDKAASYAIQHNGFRPVARIDGCQANVMGLPLCDLHVMLREVGVTLGEPDLACQAHLQITCPVARQILNSKP
jgi:septum formation protein